MWRGRSAGGCAEVISRAESRWCNGEKKAEGKRLLVKFKCWKRSSVPLLRLK